MNPTPSTQQPPNVSGVALISLGTGSEPTLPADLPPLLLDAARLHELGIKHLYPVGKDKLPIGQWRHGEQDYATVPMELKTWHHRLTTDRGIAGIAVIANQDTGVVVLDVEPAGMGETMIQAALDSLPETCQVRSRNGGRHAYLIIEGDYPTHNKNLAQHPPAHGNPDPVLLAEVRLAPNYAVIVGPGRPPLADDFRPHRIARDDYDRIVAMIRQAGTWHPEPAPRTAYTGDGTGGGTGTIIHSAIKSGSLSPLAVLPDGWRIAGHTRDGRTYIVRPGATSTTSGNVLDGVVAIHSTAVDWAPAPDDGKTAKPMSAAECLARARHGGDYAAAMRWVETLASALVEDGTVPGGAWAEAVDVLEAVYEGRAERTTRPDPATPNRDPQHPEGQLRSQPFGERLGREWLSGRWLYANGLGWHRWDGTRWKHDDDDAAVIREAHQFVVSEITALAGHASGDTIKQVARYREHGALKQLVAAARTVPSVSVDASELDAKPGLLNCTNGTVDLRTGHLRPHDPADYITKTTGTAYRPDARHADWDKALAALPDDTTQTWVRRCLGSAGTGEKDRDMPVVFHKGLGENGKSTLIGAVVAAYGDYAVLVPDQLLTGREDGHPTVWMPLRGARLAYIEELPEDHVLPVARIKKLASTPQLTARSIGKDNVTWDATHVLIVSTNYFPGVNETDHGTWRRLVMVDYPHTFTGTAKDPRLKNRLRSGKPQREAVLAWLIDGARDWYATGGDTDDMPQAVRAATAEWRAEGDDLGNFLADNVEVTGDKSHRIETKALLARFTEYLAQQNRKAWSGTKLGQRIRAHHFVASNPAIDYDRGHRNQYPMGLSGARWNVL